MFKELVGVLQSCSLNLSITMKDDTISVTIIPQGKEGKNMSKAPLVVTGNADELDKSFATDVTDALTKAIPYFNNAQEFVKAAEQQEKDVKEADKKKKEAAAKTSTASTGKTEDKKFDPKKLPAADKKVWDATQAVIKKIADAKDVDMVDYLSKQADKEMVKFKESDITKAAKEELKNQLSAAELTAKGKLMAGTDTKTTEGAGGMFDNTSQGGTAAIVKPEEKKEETAVTEQKPAAETQPASADVPAAEEEDKGTVDPIEGKEATTSESENTSEEQADAAPTPDNDFF